MNTPYIAVTAEMLDDAAGVSHALAVAFRRYSHPWEFPDRNPMPMIDPFPWVTRRIAAARDLRQRIRDARYVLANGLDEDYR